jgi:hypothetical protein
VTVLAAERTGRDLLGPGDGEVQEWRKIGLWVPCLMVSRQIGRGSGWRCPAAGSGPLSPFLALAA